MYFSNYCAKLMGKPEGPAARSSKSPKGPHGVDKDGFRLPIRRKRGRPRKETVVTEGQDDDQMSTGTAESENVYESLNDDDEGDAQPKRVRVTKVKRPPPITIPNLNFRDVQDKLKEMPDIDPHNVSRRITKEGVKIFVTDHSEHKKVRTYLDSVNTKYTTYTCDEDRMTRFVMYGLPTTDLVEVQAAILEASKLKPVAVKYMKIAKKLYPEQCNYLIYFNKTSKVSVDDLRRVTGILGFQFSSTTINELENQPNASTAKDILMRLLTALSIQDATVALASINQRIAL